MSVATTHPPAPDLATPDLTAWNETLNRTHAMGAWRARAGRVVRAIEDRRKRLVVDAVQRLRPAVVVDVGCEDGWIADGYASSVERLVLVDIDRHVLDACPLASRDNVSTVVSDVTAPDALATALGDRGADLIVLSALLEHLPQPDHALRALAPLLARDGRFLIYVPADRPILFLKRVLKATRIGSLVKGLSLEPAPGHLHVFDRRALARLLAPHGEIESLSFDPVCLGYLAVLRPHVSGAR
ncbi:MAG: methyltransferase domain-containing protein [Planctomycetota bacterium]|nr:methyltransferase domain-containing protein [Planctomycetota bacterium]